MIDAALRILTAGTMSTTEIAEVFEHVIGR